jgi:acyl-CoA reductase-like NAD-dependent aldehyde dehydrogenase
MTKKNAETEVSVSIDRFVYFAGWCDKYQQVFSTVNPVASSHFNFSLPEPTGVVAILAPEDSPLAGLTSVICSAISGGNTAIILASEKFPLSAVSLSEVLNSSDVPAGVINIITGKLSELYSHFASHMDVNAVVNCRNDESIRKQIEELATLNVKRVFNYKFNWLSNQSENPYTILDLQEIKTTWHPIENIGVSGAKY